MKPPEEAACLNRLMGIGQRWRFVALSQVVKVEAGG